MHTLIFQQYIGKCSKKNIIYLLFQNIPKWLKQNQSVDNLYILPGVCVYVGVGCLGDRMGGESKSLFSNGKVRAKWPLKLKLDLYCILKKWPGVMVIRETWYLWISKKDQRFFIVHNSSPTKKCISQQWQMHSKIVLFLCISSANKTY